MSKSGGRRPILARRTDIRPSTISDYYNEMTDRINIRHFEVICKVLNCKLSDLLVEVPDDEAKPRAARRSRKKRLKK